MKQVKVCQKCNKNMDDYQWGFFCTSCGNKENHVLKPSQDKAKDEPTEFKKEDFLDETKVQGNDMYFYD
jgi:predicted amidophosphoribosyltransferase